MTKLTEKAGAPSILSRGLQINGDIRSSGILEIEGKAKGTIQGTSVVIRENGIVEGSIEADSLSIYGSFQGDIKSEVIHVFRKAKIMGNIEYNSISVEDGASIEGNFKKMEAKTAKIANENQVAAKIIASLKK